MKKKERKDYRKKHDVHYNLIHSIKQHYESLRRFVALAFHIILTDLMIKGLFLFVYFYFRVVYINLFL
jgi:hypothetical protein